jgi:ATPase subunit of ABC transporter with duplicated ATPase domains
MRTKQKTLLQFNNLSLSYGDNVILNGISGSIKVNDRIGLIGINGSGKSSLLKILTEQIKPDSGTIQSKARIEYSPQLNLEMYRTDEPLYKYLQKRDEQWWNVLIKHEEIFGISLNENQPLNTLSGGELIKVNLSLVLAQDPDIVLLDEPTNHLDLKSLEELNKVLNNLEIPYIIVSHNTDFVNKTVNTIWELKDGKLKIYGGNYEFYKEQKSHELEAKKRKYKAKKKEIQKLEKSLENEQRRAQRSYRTGRKFAKFGGTDGFAQTYLTDKAEKSAATNRSNLLSKKAEARKEMEGYKADKRKPVYLDFYTKPKNGLIIRIKNGKLSVNNSTTLLEELNFTIHHGDRIAILGDNGSGKTSLVKEFNYKGQKFLTGNIGYGEEYKTLYVDQQYDVVQPNLTVIENILKYNRKINYENARRILGNLSFPMDYDINKKAKKLSGGEVARLAFAIATSSKVDLLVLDEPTNNLDIETVGVIADTLVEFQGTLVVISHDISFLKRINIKNVYEIKNSSLNETDLDNLNSNEERNV